MPPPKDPIKRAQWIKDRSEKMKGKVTYIRTEEQKEQCRERNIGTTKSDATKEKMRKSHMGEKNSQWVEKPEVFCKICGKQLTRVKPAELKLGWNQYCSNECKYKDHGEKVSKH